VTEDQASYPALLREQAAAYAGAAAAAEEAALMHDRRAETMVHLASVAGIARQGAVNKRLDRDKYRALEQAMLAGARALEDRG